MTCTILVFPQSAAIPLDRSSDTLSGQVVALDAYRINRDFPDAWQAYLRAHFDCIRDVALAFGVTERAARRWWDGAGPRGAFVAIALRLHPETAPGYLLGSSAVGVAA